MNDDEENLYESGTEIGTDKADDDYTVKLKAVYKEPNPTAVLYNDGTFIFYEDAPDPADEALHSGIMPKNDVHPEEGLSIYPGQGSWATEIFDDDRDLPWWLHRDYDIITVQFKGVVKPKSTKSWFSNTGNLQTFISDGLDTSNVTDMSFMFYHCYNLQTVSLEGLDTSQVQNIQYMFTSCLDLTNVDGLDTWDTSNVTYMYEMFKDCPKLTKLDLSDWDVSNVTDMDEMFAEDYCLQELNLSNWKPEKVEDIFGAFNGFNKNGATPAKIYAQDWTFNQNINKKGMYLRKLMYQTSVQQVAKCANPSPWADTLPIPCELSHLTFHFHIIDDNIQLLSNKKEGSPLFFHAVLSSSGSS